VNNEHAAQDPESHSFILKIWIEETAAEAGYVVWRGSLSHVPDGSRRYFTDLETMADFVGNFIEGMGGDVGMRFRVRKQIRHFQRLFHDRMWGGIASWFH